jgi:hypothetical protein
VRGVGAPDVLLRRRFVEPRCLVLAALTVGVEAAACSGERYARPEGPAPRYEAAPVLAWDGGAPQPEPQVGASRGERSPLVARAVRLAARSAIPGMAKGALDERHDHTNVSDQ